jgi:GTPase SAR1 family protein
MWPTYYRHAQGVIFVIDSCETSRIGLVRDELQHLSEHQDIREGKQPILFFLNKIDAEPDEQDGGEKLSVQRVERILQLGRLKGSHAYHVQPSSGSTGAGVDDGFRWLSEACLMRNKNAAAEI